MMMRGVVSLLAVLALLASACGDTGAETTTQGVASEADLDETLEDARARAAEALAAEEAAASPEDSADGEAASPEEAALAFAVCMRDNGFTDFPDPVIGADGVPNIRAAVIQSGFDFTQAGFREQAEACRDEVGADNLGAGARDSGVREQIQERLLGYTQCLRDQGLDVGDLGAPGQGAQGAGQAGNGQGAGRAQGNIGTVEGRGQRVAQALGLDPDDPDTALALGACDDVLVEAFAGLAGGRAPANG